MRARAGSVVAAILVSGLVVPLAGWGQTKPTAASTLAASAQELEHQQRWLEAAQVYAQLITAEPDNPSWQEGLRRCLIQERIAQRYRDGAIRHIMSTWKLAQALAAYDELTRLIEQVVIDHITVEQLWRRGCEQVLLALNNRIYREVAFRAKPSASQLEKLRSLLEMEMSRSPEAWSELTGLVRSLAERAALYAPMRPTSLVWEFLAAHCESVDAYGAYVTPTGLVLEKILVEEKWAGVGLTVLATDQGVVIIAVAPQSEAHRHGIVPGSKLTRVNGEPLHALSTEEVMLRLLGQPDTNVTLEVVLPDGTPQSFTLTRRRLDVPSVTETTMLDSMLGIGYIRITQFQPNTPQELDQALEELNQRGLRVLLLDLRGNPGGSVRAALDVADRFISEGILLRTEGRLPELTAAYHARRGNDWQIPLIVLVDENTASAAEMVAAALQAQAQAVRLPVAIVGKPTRGKAVLQHLIPLAEGHAGAAYLTVARWLTPAGTPISPQGIQPDVLVKVIVPMHVEPMMDMDMLPMGDMNGSIEGVAWQTALRKAVQFFYPQP